MNKKYIEEILSESVSLLAVKDDAVFLHEKGRGIMPLLSLYESGNMQGAEIYDKVIGKAAAILCILGKAKFVYGALMSEEAEKLLISSNIEACCSVSTKTIQNRKGDGPCPMELVVENLTDINDAPQIIREKLLQMNKQ